MRRELTGAEVGAEVTADLANRVDDVGAHLLGDLLQLLVVELVEVAGPLDPPEQRLGRLVLVFWCLRGVVHSCLVKI